MPAGFQSERDTWLPQIRGMFSGGMPDSSGQSIPPHWRWAANVGNIAWLVMGFSIRYTGLRYCGGFGRWCGRAVLASLLPIVRAVRINPAESLREE